MGSTCLEMRTINTFKNGAFRSSISHLLLLAFLFLDFVATEIFLGLDEEDVLS